MSDEMRQVILDQYQQLTKSLEVNKEVKVNGDFDSIILAGMGGSGHPGDLLNSLGVPKLPLFVHRNYNLPLDYLSHMGLNKPLVIASSYSGNTEESLSAYETARNKKIPLLASASGGTLEQWATRDKTPFSHIAFTDMQPRHTLFAAFAGITISLINSKLADDIAKEIKNTAKFVEKITPGLEEQAKKLAAKIKGRVPVFDSTDNLGFAAKNFKIQCNENAKYPAFWNTFPELNHNELVGFSKLKEMNNPNKFIAIFINDSEDHPKNKARIKATTNLYQDWGLEVENINAEGESTMQKVFYTVTLGLWTTYYLALEYDIDPVPVDGVESFKDKLKEAVG